MSSDVHNRASFDITCLGFVTDYRAVPEYPDVEIYVERLTDFIGGKRLRRIRFNSPFVLRSVEPPIGDAHNRTVERVSRLGKQIVITLEDDLHLVVHLMISGRLRWKKPDSAIPRGMGLAAFDFESGVLLFTEASKKKRASLRLVQGLETLTTLNRGGLEIFESGLETFDIALRKENHTLKRALTDQRIFSGIGNAYSDEILHRARLSPVKLTQRLQPEEVARLYQATRKVLAEWVERLRKKTGARFPDKVTAFHPEMAVHGRYGKPCPVCDAPVQRIVFADNEANYCARCQTGGKLLADRALSRLLKKNWPKTLEELD